MAYDSVDTNLLLQILARDGIPDKLLSWLYQYLRSRQVFLATEEGTVQMELSEGLPQGCPLSPILFNLYTANLHDLSNDECELVQFADDFAVIAKGKTMEEATKRLNEFLPKLTRRLEMLNLKLSVAKSAVIPFTNKNIDHLRVNVRGERLEIVNTHRYLGYTLDRSLRHRKHIEAIRNAAGKKLTLLKLLGRKTGRANPETLIKVGNAIIRSRMEYGASVFGNAAPANIGILQTLQNSYVRYAMGYLRTTPVNVLLADSGQLPMRQRIEALTKKELIRSIFFKTPNQKFICSTLSREISNGSYFTQVAEKHVDLLYQVHPAEKNNQWRRRMQYFGMIDIGKIVHRSLGEGQYKKGNVSSDVWNKLFKETMENDYKGYNRIFTDASKNSFGVAIAVYDEKDGEVLTEKINGNFTITNAEILAIQHAVEMCKNKGYSKTVILTDSRSACETLTKDKAVAENYIIWEIFKELQSMPRSYVRIQWIPSHQEIQGNEIADRAAVARTHDKQSFFNGITMSDAIILSRKEIWDEWERRYKAESMKKGKWHFTICETPCKTIWAKHLTLNTEQVKIMNRIRSGHTLTKERRAQWGLEMDDLCNLCEEVEDLKHLLYHCSKYNNIRINYNILEYMEPLEPILREKCEESMKQIAKFIKETKIIV
ncbi:uncharacterized protein LOC131675918 [Topomyia yanbarensis]|uniref:uncharacterized protein LOC131675918 n=1 Tax=Topomyia yanbarensis TaxID=2498891 RepID=UPI00273C9B37|nr:uncharacterized protein LOC131675918 [Topomyia yanbarensis]